MTTIYKNKREFLRDWKRGKNSDMFYIGRNLYMMDFYDIDGRYVNYTSIDAGKWFSVNTFNRYQSRSDAQIESGDYCGVRNDICYYASRETPLYHKLRDMGFAVSLCA